MTSSAFMFSCTCSTRLAPVITVDTRGFLAHHANASWASVQPNSSAISLNAFTFLLRRSSVSMPWSHS